MGESGCDTVEAEHDQEAVGNTVEAKHGPVAERGQEAEHVLLRKDEQRIVGIFQDSKRDSQKLESE